MNNMNNFDIFKFGLVDMEHLHAINAFLQEHKTEYEQFLKDYETWMEAQAREEFEEEQKEAEEKRKKEQAIFNKYYAMLTEEEQFEVIDDEFDAQVVGDDYGFDYLAPKRILERRKKANDNE